MAKKDEQDQPELKPDQEVNMTFDQLLQLVRTAASAGTMDAEAIAAIAAKASASAAELLHPTREIPYPGISPFNPEGSLAHPLPELQGDIYWAGYLLRGDELTRQEIELLNQVQAGDYEIRSRSGTDLPFKVRDLDPGSKHSRRLLVLFPCTTADQRHDLPTMVEMLTQVLPLAATR